MKAQFTNKLMSSFLLYLDNTILRVGEAYTNHSSLFYPDATNKFNGYYGYSAPFKQLVSDQSITGATVMSGAYVNSSFTTSNVHLNHYNGQVYFDSDQGSAKISGNYSVKDFNINMTSKPEHELLFETKLSLRPKTTQTITGLKPEQNTYPAIYVKNMGGTNAPFAFGGMENTKVNVRCVVLADSVYKQDAVCSILKDVTRDSFKIIEQTSLPFNALGMPATTGYNYTNLAAVDYSYIKDTTITNNIPSFSKTVDNPEVYPAFVDFHLEVPRMTTS
tara:strand:- start:1540 stop:2367 length:828 start_codon:yes stop_codon:yes gene_type:complete